MGQLGFIECIRERIERDDVTREGLYSLILFGSWVRGDFVDGISDLDFFAVLKEGYERIIPKLTAMLEECTSDIKRASVDLAWEYLENLDDPLHRGYPFKFLTIYQEDFLEHHAVVYGNDTADILPRYEWRDLARWRAEKQLVYLEGQRDRARRGDPKMLRIGAGEVIRLMALLDGAESISKGDVLRVLERLEDVYALEIFSAYMEGRELKYPEEYWVSFIRSRIKKILDEL
jgi:predicted nucleotidyltransferase